MTGADATVSSTVLAGLVDVVSQRLQAGGPVELTELLAANPEHASEVRRLVPALGALNDLAAVGAPSVLATSA